MSVVKMYINSSAAVPASSSIDIQGDGFITSIQLGLIMSDATPVTGEGAFAELSFLSNSTFTTNDGRGSLAQVSQRPFHVNLAATFSTITMAGAPFFVATPIKVPVNAGERVFLHLLPEGSVSAAAVAYLYIDDGLDSIRSPKRR